MDRPWIELGETIKRVRKTKGLTQENLAALLSVSKAAISKIETGISRPCLKNAEILSDKLGIKIDIILTLSKRFTPEQISDRENLAFENALLQQYLKETQDRLLQSEKERKDLRRLLLATESRLSELVDMISKETTQS